MDFRAKLDLYEKLMRLDKPIGILLLLWPTLWAQWLATGGHPNLVILWIFILGTVLMRSAGCVMNDYADRHFDPHVERTKDRPLAAGMVSEKEALLLAGFLVLLSALLLLPLNRLTWLLSVGAVFLAASYPFTKRFFAVPQAYLGIAFGFGIPMSFAAHAGAVPAVAWAMLLANVFWAVAYDTEYAMVDRDDDLRIGVKSTAILFGAWDRWIILLLQLLMLALLTGVGLAAGRGNFYLLGVAGAALLAGYQQYLIRNRERGACFRAFLSNHYYGMLVFLGLMLDYALAPGS